MCKVIQYVGAYDCDDLKQETKYGEVPTAVLDQIFTNKGLENNQEFRFDDFCQIVYGRKLHTREDDA